MKRTILFHGHYSPKLQIGQQQPAHPITHHYGQVTASQEPHKLGHQSSLHNNFYPVIGTVCEVGDGPARVCQHLGVVVVQQADQGGQDLLDGLDGRGRVLIATQVWQRPRHVPQIPRLQGLRETVNRSLARFCSLIETWIITLNTYSQGRQVRNSKETQQWLDCTMFNNQVSVGRTIPWKKTKIKSQVKTRIKGTCVHRTTVC